MTKQDKIQCVQELTEEFKEFPNFYIADTGGLNVEEVNNLRGDCFKADVKMRVAKNTLIKKALENLESDYSDVYPTLKEHSAIFFSNEENPSVPAKVISEFRKTSTKPVLKAACIQASVFIGDAELENLTKMKSKNELLGEIIGLLQSPAKNVISALKSSGNTLSGLLKTLSEKE